MQREAFNLSRAEQQKRLEFCRAKVVHSCIYSLKVVIDRQDVRSGGTQEGNHVGAPSWKLVRSCGESLRWQSSKDQTATGHAADPLSLAHTSVPGSQIRLPAFAAMTMRFCINQT